MSSGYLYDELLAAVAGGDFDAAATVAEELVDADPSASALVWGLCRDCGAASEELPAAENVRRRAHAAQAAALVLAAHEATTHAVLAELLVCGNDALVDAVDDGNQLPLEQFPAPVALARRPEELDAVFDADGDDVRTVAMRLAPNFAGTVGELRDCAVALVVGDSHRVEDD